MSAAKQAHTDLMQDFAQRLAYREFLGMVDRKAAGEAIESLATAMVFGAPGTNKDGSQDKRSSLIETGIAAFDHAHTVLNKEVSA